VDVLVVGSLGTGSRLCSSLRVARIPARLASTDEEAAAGALPGSILILESAAAPAAPRVRSVLAAHPGLRVLVLGPAEPGPDLIESLLAGAAGYLPDDLELSALVRSVQGIADGELALPRAWVRRVVDALRDAVLVPGPGGAGPGR
jgi:DNA-binding NarL/FixJ family response regulator